MTEPILKPSPLTRGVTANEDTATHIVKELKPLSEIPLQIQANLYKYELLGGCVFIGHLNTDLDSIAGAIGAAELYGGIPARAHDVVNTEITWALERWGIPLPADINKMKKLSEKRICIVDHNQFSQTPKCINQEQIVGIIDHHATQSKTIQTSSPIYFDIRPWGSMSTILAHTFMRNKQQIPVPIAGILMSAILSDTLNFKSPTTTDMDKLVVSVLAKICNVKDIDKYAQEQFKAKSKMIELFSSAELVRGDQKKFDFSVMNGSDKWSGSFGWGTLECVDASLVIADGRRDEILNECRAIKKEQNLEFFFFTVVNIVEQKSLLFICGDLEKEIAEKTFKDSTIDEKTSLMDLGNRVSRKKQFIPATMKALSNPKFIPSLMAMANAKEQKETDYGELIVDPAAGVDGQMTRIQTEVFKKKTKKMSKLRRISSVRLDEDNEDDAGVLNQSNDNSTVEFIKNPFIMFAFGITIGCAIGKKVL